MSFRPLAAAAALAACLVVASSASAQSTPSAQPYRDCQKTTVSQGESEQAHAKYIAGKQDYDEASYDQAIKRFRDAYNLDCQKHELLVIISAAYERKGDKREAVAALETYLARAQSAPDVATYERKIENLKKQIAAEKPAEKPPPPPPAESPREHSVVPWIVAGVGAAGLIAGIVVYATATPLPDGCNSDTGNCANTADTAPAADGENQRTAGLVMMIAGPVVLAGGLLWHFLEPTGPKEPRPSALRPSVKPLLGPNALGLSLGGRF